MQQNCHKDDKNQSSVLMLMILPSIYQFLAPSSLILLFILPMTAFINIDPKSYQLLFFI